MSDSKQDERLDALCHRAIVPAGYAPQSDTQIERMLDALGGDDSANRTDRILAKVLREQPMVWERPAAENFDNPSDEAVANEFAEMFRAPGEPLSEDLEEKLRAMEQRAMEEPVEEDEEADRGDERSERGGPE